MAKSGCHIVILGIEFDDDEMQHTLKKNIQRNQSEIFTAQIPQGEVLLIFQCNLHILFLGVIIE